jgi:hypothetical protein
VGRYLAPKAFSSNGRRSPVSSDKTSTFAWSRSCGPATRALAFFENDDASLDPRFLGRLRPAPLSPALRARVLTSLPTDGELSPTRTERAQLAALEPILGFHGRSGMIAIKVIDVGHAFVGLHARTRSWSWSATASR